MNFLYSQQNRELPLVIFQQKLRWALIVEVQQHMLFQVHRVQMIVFGNTNKTSKLTESKINRNIFNQRPLKKLIKMIVMAIDHWLYLITFQRLFVKM